MKKRLDIVVVEKGLVPSREKARGMIMAGEVFVNNQPITKPGTQVNPDVTITLKQKSRFVSRGGEKLAAGLAAFDISVLGAVCADVGASTGGFTDCLLQNGASRVYAIDVGYGQLAYSLRQDERVIVIERTNARYLEVLPEKVNITVIDASFISLKLLLPVVKQWLELPGYVLPLIKPQFEAGKHDVGKGGVVRNSKVHARVLREVIEFSHELGFVVRDITRSPIKGPAGNIEFLALLEWHHQLDHRQPSIERLVSKVL